MLLIIVIKRKILCNQNTTANGAFMMMCFVMYDDFQLILDSQYGNVAIRNQACNI